LWQVQLATPACHPGLPRELDETPAELRMFMIIDRETRNKTKQRLNGGKMKSAIMLLIFCAGLGFAYGLIGSGETDYITMDTQPPDLELLSPNGGEDWYIGDTNDILWTATDTNLEPESIYLWYSLGGSTQYTSLAAAVANTGSYAWEMPDTQSYHNRVQIQVNDTFGNISTRNSMGTFNITYVPPAAPDSVVVDTSNNIDAIISWPAVSSTIYDTPIEPDGYIVLYNETPYEDDQFYYYHGESTGTTYTHHNVVRRRDQMFYKIVAFKDYDGRLSCVLSSLRDSESPRLWKDILNELRSEGGVK
jgi:hypothetical protein